MRLLLTADTHVPARARDLPAQVWRAGRCRQDGIQPDGRDEQSIGNQHRVERPREP